MNTSLLLQAAYINGEWIAADDSVAVDNPATGAIIGSVPNLGAVATEQAVTAAHAALAPWQALTAQQRADILLRWYQLMLEHADDLAALMTLEQGKPLAEALGEVKYAASFMQWFAEEGKRLYGDVIPSPSPDKQLLVSKEAIGVVAAITPWNFPLAMITRKAAPALAAGCTMVLKPANETPFSALALAKLAEQAGIPAGVLNVVTGDAVAIGSVLTSHPEVRKLTFTGSTPVGRLLMQQCAATVKKMSLELGGNAPFIVFDDADLDKAVQGAVFAKFRNAGQTCVCANRFYIHRSVYAEFAQKFAAAVAQLQVGNGMDAGVNIGPLINQKAVSKVETLLQDALDKGAQVLTGGKAHALGGNFFEPTVLSNVNADMALVSDEIFGPVAPLIAFDDEAEAIVAANNTIYGLAAYVYSENLSRIMRVSRQLEYGMVGINTSAISNEVVPFGGVKQSGLGREGSKYGIEDFIETKYLCVAV
ncbi:NAD-dependent succinate-semialdehyde dehydrogenase [Vitreoscilla massiliensis]|uniref:NAD-dependent succinate-semialdehyde dehydrogenase n=1 Tax=Vitreoscilla massiliensis TaxID=1689272 RepID=A0ABY4DYT7_9NEIS|nr:NAD-dependent succinate-semialdehyde dehydrogenase [Vitreoscilla massiliensis]UOO88281.1 NAD-dependent succinate-semialdehyde dehydrogenase [Vitreoscilla massiliensis]